MDFKDNPEQASFRKNCREWLEKNAKLKIGVEKNEFANIDFLQAAKDWQKSFYSGGCRNQKTRIPPLARFH